MNDEERAGDVGRTIERWGSDNLREFPWRGWSDRYRITVTEVLLQQTAAVRVAAFVEPWFERYQGWRDLAASDVATLEIELRPLGLHRRRADVLHRLALSMLADPEAPLAERPGVGQYISRAVPVALDGSREAMVDVNFVRIVKRVFDGPWKSDYRHDPTLQLLAAAMVGGASDPRLANWAVLDLAAAICRAGRPRCSECPIMAMCRTGASAVLGR